MTLTFDPHSNFAYSTVQAGSSIIGSNGTPKTIVLATGDGASFPTGDGVTQFNVVVWPPNARPLAANAEVVRVTRSGDTLTTTARGQEGSAALSTIAAGYQVMAAVTAKTLTDMEQALAGGIQYQVLTESFNLSVANTTSETTLFTYTIPAGTLSATQKILLSLEGDWKQNSGVAGDLPRMRAKLGGVTQIDTNLTGGNPVANDTGRYPWWVDFTVQAVSVTNQQWLRYEGAFGYKRNAAGYAQFLTGSGITKSLDGSPQDNARASGGGSSGVDMTANQDLAVTVQLPSAVNTDILAKAVTVVLLG